MKLVETGQSILLSPSESMAAGRDDFDCFLVDDLQPELAKKANIGGLDGVSEAVHLLLSRSGISIEYANTDVTDETVEIEVVRQLGFNDHRGASESFCKILLNDDQDKQHVLFSPPQADGTVSNLTFCHSSFSNLTELPSRLEYSRNVPNIEKTLSHNRYMRGLEAKGQESMRDVDCRFVLFGALDTPQRFMQRFIDIGFTFEPSPYPEKLERDLKQLHREFDERARQSIDGLDRFECWPALLGQPGQFSAQISANLEIARRQA